MKALWFLPLTYAGGAEGFALFAPYLIGVLSVLYVARVVRQMRRAMPAFDPTIASPIAVLPNVQPAL